MGLRRRMQRTYTLSPIKKYLEIAFRVHSLKYRLHVYTTFKTSRHGFRPAFLGLLCTHHQQKTTIWAQNSLKNDGFASHALRLMVELVYLPSTSGKLPSEIVCQLPSEIVSLLLAESVFESWSLRSQRQPEAVLADELHHRSCSTESS